MCRDFTSLHKGCLLVVLIGLLAISTAAMGRNKAGETGAWKQHTVEDEDGIRRCPFCPIKKLIPGAPRWRAHILGNGGKGTKSCTECGGKPSAEAIEAAKKDQGEGPDVKKAQKLAGKRKVRVPDDEEESLDDVKVTPAPKGSVAAKYPNELSKATAEKADLLMLCRCVGSLEPAQSTSALSESTRSRAAQAVRDRWVYWIF